jgi:hypothetical protein
VTHPPDPCHFGLFSGINLTLKNKKSYLLTGYSPKSNSVIPLRDNARYINDCSVNYHHNPYPPDIPDQECKTKQENNPVSQFSATSLIDKVSQVSMAGFFQAFLLEPILENGGTVRQFFLP